MSDFGELSKLYDKYIEASDKLGGMGTGGFPVGNDSFLQSKIPVISRPIVSLEGINGLNFNNFGLQVFLQMDSILDYLAGEFVYSDPDFKLISRDFVKGGYFGEVYVAYGQGYINEEIKAAGENIGNYDPFDFDPCQKGRLYRRVKLADGTYRFHSLISKVPDINLDYRKLVRVRYQGIGVFIRGLEIMKDYVACMGTYIDLLKLSTTRYKIECADDQVLRSTLESVNQGSPYYLGAADASKDVEIEPQELCVPEHPQIFLDTALNYYSEGCRRMGFVFSSESKSERMTSGEHYKNLKATSNIQNHFLAIMQGFTNQIAKKFPDAPPLEITLAYDVTGQGIPNNNKNVKKKGRYEGNRADTGLPEENNFN